MLVEPLISFDTISADELNWCLRRWGHKMGELRRPEEYGFWAQALRHNGRMVAVTAANTLIRETCAGILTREQAVELSRVCAERPDLCRAVVRIWREFVFPPLCEARGFSWAVSYQDSAIHGGNLYRFDGWVKVGRFRSGGVDPRTGRKGRSGFVWGWHADPAERAAGQLSPIQLAA